MRVVMVHHWPRARIGILLLLRWQRLLLVVMKMRLNRLVVSAVLLMRRFRNFRTVDPEHNVDTVIQRGSLGRVSPLRTFQYHIFRTVESVRLGVHIIVSRTLAKPSLLRRRRLPLLTLQLCIADRRIRQALLVSRHGTLIVRLLTPTAGNHVNLILPWRFLLRRRRPLIKRRRTPRRRSPPSPLALRLRVIPLRRRTRRPSQHLRRTQTP